MNAPVGSLPVMHTVMTATFRVALLCTEYEAAVHYWHVQLVSWSLQVGGAVNN